MADENYDIINSLDPAIQFIAQINLIGNSQLLTPGNLN